MYLIEHSDSNEIQMTNQNWMAEKVARVNTPLKAGLHDQFFCPNVG